MKLTQEQGKLLFDYCFRCAEQEQLDRASALIHRNPQATEIYSCIKETLSQLDHMQHEECPMELVEMTVARLKLATLEKPLPHKNGSQ